MCINQQGKTGSRGIKGEPGKSGKRVRSSFGVTVPFHFLNPSMTTLKIRHLLAPAGDSRHRWPCGTSRKRWPEGNWIGFVSIHVSVGQMSGFVDSNTMHRATLCLVLIKGKKGEEGPPGKQGSPVSDSCYIH